MTTKPARRPTSFATMLLEANLELARSSVRMKAKGASPSWSLYYLPERPTARWVLDRTNSCFGEEVHEIVLQDVRSIPPQELATQLQANLRATQARLAV